MTKKRGSYKSIRWQLLLIILLVSAIPVIIIFAISSRYMYQNRSRETQFYYREILGQVRNNLHIIYDQYARTLQSVFSIPEVKRGLTAPPFKSDLEEDRITRAIIGDATVEGGLRSLMEANINGYVYIIETGRESRKIPENNYVVHRVTSGASPRVPELLQDMLYRRMLEDRNARVIFGKPDPVAVSGYKADQLPMMLVPWFGSPYKENDTINSIFLCVLLYDDFMSDFYEDVPMLHKGTLYILDQFNSVLSSNHPGDLDYFEFDEENGKYFGIEDDLMDDERGMSLSDYQLLNTDPAILETDEVTDLLTEMENNLGSFDDIDPEWNETFFTARRLITFKGRKYLLFLDYEESSRSRFLYFYPVRLLQKPFIQQTRILAMVTLVILIAVLVMATFLSLTITKPIKQMRDAAARISMGIYNTRIKQTGSNEIGDLTRSFNTMAEQIHERDLQLREANIRLQNLDKMKTLFYQSVSHQLRTPLNQILGFTQLIKNRNYDPQLDVIDINKEIITYLRESNVASSRQCDVDTILEYIQQFNHDVFDKEKSIFEYYYAQMKSRIDCLPDEQRERTSELLDEMLLICSDSVSRMLNTMIKIDKSGEKILDLLDNFSSIADLEAAVGIVEKVRTEIKPFVDKLISAAMVMVFKLKKEDNLVIKYEINAAIPEFILIDSTSMNTVLTNLLSNAVRFSDSGIIRLVVTLSDNGELEFRVKDEGLGILPDDQENIFVEFWRADEVYDREGVGLGLAITRMIITLLGGEISVISTHGEGSEFRVIVPWEPMEKGTGS
jgi:signal transduction histidine kinase